MLIKEKPIGDNKHLQRNFRIMTSAAVNALGQKLFLEWRKEHPTESIIFSPFAAAATLCLIRDEQLSVSSLRCHTFTMMVATARPLETRQYDCASCPVGQSDPMRENLTFRKRSFTHRFESN